MHFEESLKVLLKMVSLGNSIGFIGKIGMQEEGGITICQLEYINVEYSLGARRSKRKSEEI